MADIPFPTNLMAGYTSPQELQVQQAQAQQMGAAAGLMGQQSQAAFLQNQITQKRLDIYNKNVDANIPVNPTPQDTARADAAKAAAVSNGQNTPAPAPGTLEDAGLTPTQVRAHQDQRFQVSPLATPQEQAAMDRGTQLDLLDGKGGTANRDAAAAPYLYRIATARAAASQTATTEYDNLHDLATFNGSPGTALGLLQRSTDPADQQAAAQFTALAKANGWDDTRTDNVIRDYATAAAGGAFTHSRYLEGAKPGDDGVWRDNTGRPVIGATASGISKEQTARLTLEAQKANSDTVVALSPIIATAKTAASIERQASVLDQQEGALNALRTKIGHGNLTNQIAISELPPVLRPFVRQDTKVVQLGDLVAAVNANATNLDAAILKNEGVSGALQSDERAQSQSNAANPLRLDDNDATWQQKMANRQQYRAQAREFAKNSRETANNQISSLIDTSNSNPLAKKLDAEQFRIQPPAKLAAPAVVPPKAAARAAPAVGTVEQGHRFNGGDPSKPESWTPVSGAPGSH